MSSDPDNLILQKLTTQIISAYVAHNEVSGQDLPNLIRTIHQTLSNVANTKPEIIKPTPAVPPKKSVFPDYIICLEDGKKLKLLRRHLQTVYDMTPQQYRERWDLPPEYPMVAPNYASHRSNLARKIGLGHRR
ncbi:MULTISPECIES: MucR family transcriptional regulator [Asaia]|uniref:MucR family transcriptional regulator n=2 Tax=Asaia bogorensis TaxID=91915 RepID=A0AAN4R138_9PROT|nr:MULTISPECIES: MucR family transcriptional regulator [Asaia]MDR6183640.1 putative transcriptional regulator [Asaia bogorensis NBRC 16594]NIE80202.1 MucR family transcriptional regulator [Asaia sp. As-1742]CDG39775.1 Transcriptional regulator [Asaia bogorensis]BAT18473.1 transcriptional regulator Ros/MucR [Asaia bogorensis NBRC 16594]GBQ74897.1 Ros/MucR family transcriptional regulator [Asaia bogorensis NBRC 16594]